MENSLKKKINNPLTIGFIGTGLIGSALARLSVAANFKIVLSNSRGPESLTGLVAELGSFARASTVEDTISSADIVITPLPMETYEILPVDKLAGKIVIDTMNYYPTDEFHISDLDEAKFTSSELVQRHLKDSKVVKAFHNVGFYHLLHAARPKGSIERTTVPIASDDINAKQIVASFISTIGYDTIDAGTLKESWRIEPGTEIYFSPYTTIIPEGLTDSESMKIYLEEEAPPLSKASALDFVNNATRIFPVGGRMDRLPQAHIAAYIEFTNKRF